MHRGPHFSSTLRSLRACTLTYLGMFGHDLAKPTKIYSNMRTCRNGGMQLGGTCSNTAALSLKFDLNAM